ncbi:MAG: class I SAM-dependent rRNA methyltransferase [Longimicrobiales bacterium]
MTHEARSADACAAAVVRTRGAARWTRRLHPWIYQSDVIEAPGTAGVVRVLDERGSVIGMALASPVSTIALRMLTHDERPIDASFWNERIARAAAYRSGLTIHANAYRLVHAEADGLPGLIVDRYGPFLAVQFLTAGVEVYRADIAAALDEQLRPAGILARDDVPIRRHERLGGGIHVVSGEVPDEAEVEEAGIRFLVALRAGQKTGAFLDQRENRVRAGQLSHGRALDCFSYHGSFALHLARGATTVTAVDSSSDALERAQRNAQLNGFTNIEFLEANVFELLRSLEAANQRFDMIVLDPPAFAKSKQSVTTALRGYKEINLRAMRLLAPGGHLCTFSCSYHVGRARFDDMLAKAAADAGRPLRWLEWRGQAADHPGAVQIPESSYLKGAVLEAL